MAVSRSGCSSDVDPCEQRHHAKQDLTQQHDAPPEDVHKHAADISPGTNESRQAAHTHSAASKGNSNGKHGSDSNDYDTAKQAQAHEHEQAGRQRKHAGHSHASGAGGAGELAERPRGCARARGDDAVSVDDARLLES